MRKIVILVGVFCGIAGSMNGMQRQKDAVERNEVDAVKYGKKKERGSLIENGPEFTIAKKTVKKVFTKESLLASMLKKES